MSNDQLHELDEVAKMLIAAREELEKLVALGDLPGIDALHSAISHAHWLCHCIYGSARVNSGQEFRALCGN